MQDGRQLDRADRKIIEALSRDGRLPVTELARQVGLSKTPCQIRLRRLMDDGVIRGFRAILDPSRLGLDQVVFVEVRLSDTSEAALDAFNRAVADAPQIEQCHMIAGAFDYLLKLRSRDMADYRQVLGSVVSSLPHVASTSPHVSMQSVKDQAF